MIKRCITQASAIAPIQEIPDEERKRLRKNFNPIAARRLTTLSLLLGELTKDSAAESADEWIFASKFGGTISLEHYLNSFPTPSPLHFQNSIQPGPLDLVNVSRKLPGRQLLPLIATESLLGEALLAALISPSENVHLVGGEEYTPWAAEHNVGSRLCFGFYLKLSQSSQASIGQLSFEAEADAGPVITAEKASTLIQSRLPICFTLPERGALRITW